MRLTVTLDNPTPTPPISELRPGDCFKGNFSDDVFMILREEPSIDHVRNNQTIATRIWRDDQDSDYRDSCYCVTFWPNQYTDYTYLGRLTFKEAE